MSIDGLVAAITKGVVIEWEFSPRKELEAFWKGFLLRKKLISALADVKSDEVEDEYEAINVDAFTFSEAIPDDLKDLANRCFTKYEPE
ncbi:hypothetical protein DUI87_20757 [Hirundo rustica rustica]|uniref:Uncharacterized protein n=1 Tax=Hirundo rustica rustica TaxID=333673 RepID=A0A3M0K8U5_HIRRU|nr:hypothetical protein DUI87_20757 [Hirundo rustica rustica]